MGSVTRSAISYAHNIPCSSKNILQVDRIQSGARREFAIGLGTLFRFASWVANERSDPEIGPGTFFRVGTALVRVGANGEIGPRTFFRSIQRFKDGDRRRDRSKNIFRVSGGAPTSGVNSG